MRASHSPLDVESFSVPEIRNGDSAIEFESRMNAAGLLAKRPSSRQSPPAMERPKLKIVILGLSITSSWGNGHATTYRGLVRELCARNHDVLFLERDTEWY